MPPPLHSPPSQALCPAGEVNRSDSDVYHLAVNLMDRFLSYESVKSEKDFYATSAASAMISLKIRRAREECLSYEHLRYHFGSVPETRIRVSKRVHVGGGGWGVGDGGWGMGDGG